MVDGKTCHNSPLKNDREVLVEEKVRKSIKRRKVDSSVTKLHKPQKEREKSVTGDEALAPASRGMKMVALAKTKVADCPGQNPFRVSIYKSTADTATVSARKRKVPMEHKQSEHASWKARELDCSLLIRMIGQPIGSGTFGDRFLGEYCGIKVTIKEMKRRNESLKENNATRRKFCTRLEYCPALAITKVYHFFWGYAWTRTIFTDHTISRLRGGESHPPQSHQNENTEQHHNSGDLCRCLPSC